MSTATRRISRGALVRLAVVAVMVLSAGTVSGTGASAAPSDEVKLVAPPRRYEDERFGYRVGIDGPIAGVVGVDAVWGFRNDGAGWGNGTKLQVLESPGLAVDGGRIYAGSWRSLTVYVNELDEDGNWATSTIRPRADRNDTRGFGQYLSADGDRIAVGAHWHRLDDWEEGSVYVYEARRNGGWHETWITASDPRRDAEFGRNVALEGDLMVVGDLYGGVYLYEREALGSWSETKLDFTCRYCRFAIEEGRIYALNLGEVWEPDGAGGVTRTKLPFAGGYAVHGDRVATTSAGAAYIHEPDGAGGWTETRFESSDRQPDDRFGFSVDIDADQLIVGAPYFGERDVGAAYVFGTGAGRPSCDRQEATRTGSGDIRGTDGDDVIVGSPTNDRILAVGGNDLICAGPGDDVVRGGDGDDRLIGGPGADRLYGGPGIDVADYSIAPGPVTVVLNLQADDGTIGEGDRVDPSVENVVGSPFDDVVIGNAADNLLDGGDGNDVLRGREGNDLLLGGSGDDKLIGGPGDDELQAGSGDDFCRGSAGLDVYFKCETTFP